MAATRVAKWLALSGVIFIASPGSAQFPETTRKPLVTETPEQLIAAVLERSEPVWKFDGYELLFEDGTALKVARLVYTPFQSSERFCRAYVTTVSSPGWFCEERCAISKDRTYHVETHPYVAPLSLLKDGQCS